MTALFICSLPVLLCAAGKVWRLFLCAPDEVAPCGSQLQLGCFPTNTGEGGHCSYSLINPAPTPRCSHTVLKIYDCASFSFITRRSLIRTPAHAPFLTPEMRKETASFPLSSAGGKAGSSLSLWKHHRKTAAEEKHARDVMKKSCCHSSSKWACRLYCQACCLSKSCVYWMRILFGAEAVC